MKKRTNKFTVYNSIDASDRAILVFPPSLLPPCFAFHLQQRDDT